MSITKILTEKDVAAEDKLERVAEIVAGAREDYGNKEAKFDMPTVNTSHGNMPFGHLEADSKVELLRNEVACIKAQASEFCTQNTGVLMNKKIQELLSTNPLFTNIDAGAKFEYI